MNDANNNNYNEIVTLFTYTNVIFKSLILM